MGQEPVGSRASMPSVEPLQVRNKPGTAPCASSLPITGRGGEEGGGWPQISCCGWFEGLQPLLAEIRLQMLVPLSTQHP